MGASCVLHIFHPGGRRSRGHCCNVGLPTASVPEAIGFQGVSARSSTLIRTHCITLVLFLSAFPEAWKREENAAGIILLHAGERVRATTNTCPILQKLRPQVSPRRLYASFRHRGAFQPAAADSTIQPAGLVSR